jgi:uncharacterized repeat protein (TIGR01451 family)
MSSILSTISGQFGKAWLLGALLPAALFTVLWLLCVQPLLPAGWQVAGPTDLDSGNVLVVVLATVLLSGLLFHLNIPLIRMYEGYPWRDGPIGRWRTAHYARQLAATEARWRGMRTLLRAMPAGAEASQIRRWRDRLGIRRIQDFPGEPQLALPTRLGNVIRAFEEYPRLEYGFDAIALWPHLLTVVDKESAAIVDDEKLGFDFMLNSSFLLAALALATLYAGLAQPFPLARWGWLPWQWLAQVALFAALAILFYRWAIHRAETWGAAVRATIETHRWDLLRKLGYQDGPVTRAAERDLWHYVSQQILRRDAPSGPAAQYVVRTFVQGVPRGIVLEVDRGIEPASLGGEPRVVLTVRNSDRRPARDVTVTDTLPDSVDYHAGSATDGARPVRASGSNPYRFFVGDLDPGCERQVTYLLVPRNCESAIEPQPDALPPT